MHDDFNEFLSWFQDGKVLSPYEAALLKNAQRCAEYLRSLDPEMEKPEEQVKYGCFPQSLKMNHTKYRTVFLSKKVDWIANDLAPDLFFQSNSVPKKTQTITNKLRKALSHTNISIIYFVVYDDKDVFGGFSF